MRYLKLFVCVSERTINRCMFEYGLKKREFSKIIDEQLDTELLALTKEFPSNGELMLDHLLKGRGLYVQRSRLPDSIHHAGKGGIEASTRRRLERRTYNVKGPNHLCHTDTNHKLIRWYIIILEVIDGFICLPLSLECIDSNKASIILSCILKSVNTYWMPSRVRSNQDKENVNVVIVEQEKEACLQVKVHTTSVLSGFGGMYLRVLLHSITRFSHLWKTVQSLILSLCIHSINKWEVRCLVPCLVEAPNTYS